MGIDPEGVVHIGRRLLDEQDGPMLRESLEAFTVRQSTSRGDQTTPRPRAAGRPVRALQ